MRIKAIFGVLVALAWSMSYSAQILEPVKWNITVNPLEGKEMEVVAKATIDAKWHIYALLVSSDPTVIGPIATTFILDPNPSFKLIGGPSEGKYITHFDPNFDLDLNYFENTATFKQKIALTGDKPFKLKGVIEYEACDDSRCIFPDPVNFSLQVNPKSAEGKTSEITELETPLAANSTTNSGGMLEPVKWSVKSEKLTDGTFAITFTSDAEEGWHVYSQHLPSSEGPIPSTFKIETFGKAELIGETKEGQPTKVYDKNFQMDLFYFSGKADFVQKIKLNSETATVDASVDFMCCNDEGCLPPRTLHFHVQLPSGVVTSFEPESYLPSKAQGINDPFRIFKAMPDQAISTCGHEEENNSLWAIFILGILGGLLALVTPCVFPMIPLTVSFFTKGSEGNKGKMRAILYGFFILIIYFLLSLPFHLSKNVDPAVLNNLATSVWLNSFFFIIFIVFAISFFGYYEITLPSSFANKVDSASNVGGLIGIFFMALTLAIVSFSCTGPILGSVIGSIYATDAEGTFSFLGMELSMPAAKVSAAMVGFGLSLGLPFGLFAAFPSMLKKLPKSGGWLEDFKVSLGFLEVALALKFLSNADLVQQWGVIKREVFFGAWILVGTLWVLYLLGIFKFKKGQGSKKLSKVKLIFALGIALFTLRLVPGLFPSSEYNRFAFLSGFPPPRGYSFYQYDEEFHVYRDLAEAMKEARRMNKPVFVDFTGWACVNCRKMEENVWPNEKVKSLLTEDYIMCSLYVDEKVELPGEEQFDYTTADGRIKTIHTVGNKWATLQTETFNNNSQPFYVLLAPDSILLAPPEKYNDDIAQYAAWLNCGKDAFKVWENKKDNLSSR